MKSLNFTERTDALIVAPKMGKAAEVAVYTTNTGDTIISNADIRPYSPLDGTHLQRLNSKSSEISAEFICDNMVDVAHCTACDHMIKASASFADSIEVSGQNFHCPMCSSEVTHNINTSQLITALASEYDDSDEDEDQNNDSEDDSDDDQNNDSDEDFDADEAPDEDESEEDEAPEDEDYDDDSDYDEDDSDSGEDEAPEDDESTDDDSESENKDDEHAAEMAAAVKELRKKVVAMGLDCDDNQMSDENPDDAEDESIEEENIPDNTVDENQGVPYEDDYEDHDLEGASVAFRKVVAHIKGERPIAGKGLDRPDIEKMNRNGREFIRNNKDHDGNRNMKGAVTASKKGEVAEEQDLTPGTTVKEGEKMTQVATPGSNVVVPANSDKQDKIPGNESVAGDLTVDWLKDNIELVATSDKNSLWIFANARPIGKIVKDNASTGIKAKWNEISALQNAFVAVCRRGLNKTEAADFGFVPENFKVEGEAIVRKAMQRQSALATENAHKIVARNVDRYKQSVRTAAIAAFKGIYHDLANPTRELLVASLSSLSVAEPRSIVDTAFAKTSEALLISIFNKADEIATKSDDARNEEASFVAKANYQARIDDSIRLTEKLVANNSAIVAAGTNNMHTVTEPTERNSEEKEYSATVRSAIRSLF